MPQENKSDQRFQFIQPQPPRSRVNSAREEPMSAKRRAAIHLACDTCRFRKVKCDGCRPQCGQCQRRRRQCVYRFDQTFNREAMTAEIEELRKELAAQRGCRGTVSDESTPEATITTHRPEMSLASPYAIETMLPHLRANINIIQEAFVYFSGCTDFLFYSYSAADAFSLLERIREGAEPVTTSLLCQVCAMAAVGSCFSRGKIPATLSDWFYTATKVYLDDCIENDPRSAVKVCALLAARNIVLKATVALAYIEVGLGLSRNLGLYTAQAPPTIAARDWLEQRRVWRCLLTLQFWLQTTLGWLPDQSVAPHELTGRDVELQVPLGLDDNEFFQQAMARIAIQKHKLLQVLSATERVPVSHFVTLRQALQEWYDTLPADAQVSNLAASPVSSVIRFKLYYLHLSNLGARLLLFRCLIRRYESTSRDTNDFSLLANWEDEGLTAARQSARLSYLMYSESGAVRHCWLCIFQAYVSCCLLMHVCFQRVLRGLTDSDGDEDLLIVQRMLEVLSYCGELDPLARSFHGTLKRHLLMLEEAAKRRQLFPTSTIAMHGADGRLCKQSIMLSPAEGNTKYHDSAAALFELVVWPFGSRKEDARQQNKRIEARHTLINHEEISLGVHAEWVAELTTNCNGSGLSSSSGAATLLSSCSSGSFASSHDPNGWTPTRSRESYIQGAVTLELLPTVA